MRLVKPVSQSETNGEQNLSLTFLVGTAGAGSLLLEFATLSRLTGDDRFEKAAYKVK